MIYPDTKPEIFSIKYGVPIIRDKCRNCGKEVDINIPVIAKEYVGFESIEHECGKAYKISYVKPR